MEIKAKDEKKINFFQRLKKSIFELEDYGFFLGERLSVAFKYLFLLTVLISIIVTCFISYRISNMLNKGLAYLEDKFPEFSYENGILDATKYEEGYDEEFDFKIIVDTNSEINNELVKKYKTKLYEASNGVILLKDKFICSFSGSELENSYTSLTNVNYDSENTQQTNDLKISNKQDLIGELTKLGLPRIVISYASLIFVALLLANLMFILSDVFILTLLGLISAKICGVNFKMDPMMILSIYALTLPTVIDAILDIVLITTGFNVPYYDAIRMLIAYIYVIAAIFMIKYDLIKQREELQKIAEVQKQVKEEINEEKLENIEKQKEEIEKEENNKEEKNTTDDDEQVKTEENHEPDGSEI